MRAVAKRHLGEATLLRIAARDMKTADGTAARKHLESCAACRTGLASAKRMDRSLSKLAGALRKGESGGDPGPDAKYFEFVDRLLEVSEEAKEAAERILRGARASEPSELDAALRALDGQPHRGLALLYAAQKADKLVAEDPNKILALSRQLSDEAASLPAANARRHTEPTASRQTVLAESALLASQALLQKGEAKAARDAAKGARRHLRGTGGLGFSVARCDYYEGAAASFEQKPAVSEKLLRQSLRTFVRFSQSGLIARAEAALGTLLSNMGNTERALPHLIRSLEALDPVTEPQRVTMVLNNLATALMRLGRFSQARSTFARALGLSRRHNYASHLFFIRTGLAELEFRRGEYRRALRAFGEIVREASPLASRSQVLLSRLYVAECHSRLGGFGPMANEIDALRRERQANLFTRSPALSELFVSLDQGAIDADLIAHVREYLQDAENGVKRSYRPLRRAGQRGR